MKYLRDFAGESIVRDVETFQAESVFERISYVAPEAILIDVQNANVRRNLPNATSQSIAAEVKMKITLSGRLPHAQRYGADEVIPAQIDVRSTVGVTQVLGG